MNGKNQKVIMIKIIMGWIQKFPVSVGKGIKWKNFEHNCTKY